VAIVDRREIEFDLHAVRLVLGWSPNGAQAFGLPPLTPYSVRCRPAEGAVEVSYGQLASTRAFTLRAEALGAILISYCHRAAIPMPRTADKAVRIEREHVVVVLTLRLSDAPQPHAPEGNVSRDTATVHAGPTIEPEL
jgi:hypothetical protein